MAPVRGKSGAFTGVLRQEASRFREHLVCIDEANPYFAMIRSSWNRRLREVFQEIENPAWEGETGQFPLQAPSERYQVLRKITNPNEKLV